VLSMRPLQNVLMDRNILFNIRDWIEPKDAHTLPAMSIRTAMYELLLQLPCTPEYLKRSDGEKAPIGVTIVALRTHKMETPANKRLLKELMDKWSRPIFSKSTDVRLAAAADHHSEVQQAVVQKYAKAASSSGADGVQEVFGAGGGFKQIDDAAGNEDGDGTKKKTKGDEARMRARTPFNQGFLYTVQPQSRKVDKSNIMERSLGQGRMKLFKTTSEGVMGKGKGLGKKENPRAMDTAVSRL
jgi:transcription factor SPN1